MRLHRLGTGAKYWFVEGQSHILAVEENFSHRIPYLLRFLEECLCLKEWQYLEEYATNIQVRRFHLG
jgi:hypothetical protein